MKKILITTLMMMSFLAVADEGMMEAHGNPEDEQKCFKEVHALGCGNPDNHQAFIACVDKKVNQLSAVCQAFHKDEVQRMKGHDHDH